MGISRIDPAVRKDTTDASRVLPLRLTPFERYMLADDRADYPMTFFIELVLSGSLDRGAFESALNCALAGHPLLQSVVERRAGCWHWVPSDERPQAVWSEGDPLLPTLRQCRINLEQQPGVRVWVGRRDARARAVFQFHHAATDGIGAVGFLGDLLALYGRTTAADPEDRPELEERVPAALLERGRLWSGGSAPAGIWKRAAARMVEFASRQPCVVAQRSSESSRPIHLPADPFVTRILERTMLAALKAEATRRGVTCNELYLLAMFRTLQEWNADCGHYDARASFRIGVPSSLRTPIHDGSPAANIISYMFLTRRGAEIADEPSLLRFIHRESQLVLNSEDSRLLPFSLGWIGCIPGGIPFLTRLPVRFATAMLANVGDVRRQLGGRFPLRRGRCVAGNVTLEGLLGAAPVRPGMHLGMSLGTYGGRLFVNLNCDPLRFSASDAARMADLFIARLLDLGGIKANDCLSSVEFDDAQGELIRSPALPEEQSARHSEERESGPHLDPDLAKPFQQAAPLSS